MAKAIVRLPDELHRALKMEAVKRGVTMQELVHAAVERIVSEGSEGSKRAAAPGKSSSSFERQTEEEAELTRALVMFLRRQKPPVRSVAIRVIRALLQDELLRSGSEASS